MTGVTDNIQQYTVESRIREPIWDTVIVPAASGTSELKMWTQPVGAAGSTTAFGTGVKTFVDTSMEGATVLPIGWHFTAEGVAMVGWTAALGQMADLISAVAGALLVVEVSNSRWLRIPAKLIPGGAGVEGAAASAVGGVPLTQASAHYGVAIANNIYPFDEEPLQISGALVVAQSLLWPGGGGAPTLTAATPISFVFHGYKERRT
jgi:hypothetical protein